MGRAAHAALPAVVVVVLFLAVLASGVTPVRLLRVASASMSPTLSAGDLLLVLPVGTVSRGDVVTVGDPLSSDVLVKRVVAVGGQQVGLEDGVLVVDGQPVCEPLVDQTRVDGVYAGPYRVPPGGVFLMGDSRGASIDSRVFGSVPAGDLTGRIAARAWPRPGSLPDPQAGC